MPKYVLKDVILQPIPIKLLSLLFSSKEIRLFLAAVFQRHQQTIMAKMLHILKISFLELPPYLIYH